MREVVSRCEASAKADRPALRDAVTGTAEYLGPDARHGWLGAAAADSYRSDVAPR
jgi:hypothetical protein